MSRRQPASAQHEEQVLGGTAQRRARTGAWLLTADGRSEDPPPAAMPGLRCLTAHGDLVTARPALAEFDDYPFPARPWGGDAPSWSGVSPSP